MGTNEQYTVTQQHRYNEVLYRAIEDGSTY